MPTPIIFTVTDAGLNAALDAVNTGLTLELSHVAIGAGQYAPSAGRTALESEFTRATLSGGDIETGSHTMKCTAILESVTTRNAFEVGLMTSAGVLFAVASTEGNEPLIVVTSGVAFIASFGLSLVQLPSNSVEVVIDPNSAINMAMLTQHVGASDPHPQYAMKAQNDLEHDNLLSLIMLNTQARQNGDDYLLDLINALSASLSGLYPKTIASGVVYDSSNSRIPRSMLSSTVGWNVGGTNNKDITNTLGIDLTNVRYGISLTPEGGHEAWNITRKQNGFYLNMFNRSGTNRIGYNGNINWSVIETMPSGVDEGNGSYGAGTYSFLIYPNTTKNIRLWGGGAGGGASSLSTQSERTDATNGGDTTFTIGSTVLGVNGGGAGTNGVWANGSAYNNGEKGEGGSTFHGGSGFSISSAQNGADGGEANLNHAGGSSGRFGDYGRGGDGGDGVGDEGYSWGGGGGEGGYLQFTYSNTGTDPVMVRLVVGTAGDGGTANGVADPDNTANGHNGVAGFATVSSV